MFKFVEEFNVESIFRENDNGHVLRCLLSAWKREDTAGARPSLKEANERKRRGRRARFLALCSSLENEEKKDGSNQPNREEKKQSGPTI